MFDYNSHYITYSFGDTLSRFLKYEFCKAFPIAPSFARKNIIIQLKHIKYSKINAYYFC